MYPDNLKYTETHQWVRAEGNVVTVGITNYAQEQLGEVVYLDLPQVGDDLTAGEVMGSVESVKSISDLYSPVGGEVTEVNQELKDHPEYVNQDPYGKGWIIRLRGVKDNSGLLDHKAYDAFVQGQSTS